MELKVKIFLLQNISSKEMQVCIAGMIDKTLCEDAKWKEFHEKNCYKFYSFNSLSPIEKDAIYKKECVYQFSIRTVNAELAGYLLEKLPQRATPDMKGLTASINFVTKRPIQEIAALTPILVKCEERCYWNGVLTFEEFQRKIRDNLIKKYNQLQGQKISEDFLLWNLFEKTNQKPIPMAYKGKTLLGDKVRFMVADNPMAQELAYLSIAAGLGEANGRGNGYVNYRYC